MRCHESLRDAYLGAIRKGFLTAHKMDCGRLMRPKRAFIGEVKTEEEKPDCEQKK
jgi:hypothetical protein